LSNCEFDSLEIGVHHGKFFIGVENITPMSCRCVALDVFSMQTKNIDGSGKGNLEIFTQNYQKYAIDSKRVIPIEMDSLDVDCHALGIGKFGIISIDGGHTEMHTISDLRSAQKLMLSNGIVVLDDILNQDWGGVVTGACQFFQHSMSNRLVPFAIGFNKLYCCHFSASQLVRKAILNDKNILTSIGIKSFKRTEFAGHPIISLK
jgi:hypothetical protein